MHSLGNDIKISENDGEDIELLSHLNKKKLSIIEEKFPKDGKKQLPARMGLCRFYSVLLDEGLILVL